MKRRVVVVCNPTKKGIDAVRKQIDFYVDKHGYSKPTWIATVAGDGGVAATRRALEKSPDLVLVVGGDGTVRAAASVMHGTGVPIGIIPRGTGNLLARNLDLPVNDMRALVRIAFEGRDRNIDVAHASTDGPMGPRSAIFMVMAGIGLDAAMAAETNPRAKARFGWLAYLRPIVKATLKNDKSTVTVVLEDGRQDRRRQHTAIIGNCGTLAGGVLLMPWAKLDDGLLDVLALDPKTVFGWTSIAQIIAIGSAVKKSPLKTKVIRAMPRLRSIRYRQTPRVEWRFDTPEMVQYDGDPFGEISSAVVTVLNKALCVRVSAE